ncbi:hypothetical protein [Sporosarcina sp.]|uniref:hypothetical protein n=1 Tax=Sporosarcina sp. TaxID=49982 RepID=UPI002629D521|nr:hypothetical protein [Sporosarcina sp.]
MKKRHLMAPLGLSLLLLGACSGDSEEEKKADQKQTEPAEDKSPDVVDKSDTTSSDEDLKEEFSKEIAKKFYDRIEKEYPEHNIDIQARKNGETFVQEMKEAAKK